MNPTKIETTRAYYSAAVMGLRALEANENRGLRFSPEADARWARFCGQLHTGDRLQMMLRDASAAWGTAFAAARIFPRQGVALDEPFGAAWPTPSPEDAQAYLDVTEPPSLTRCAELLGITPAALELPELRPTAQFMVAGGAAILALALAFAERDDLDWSRQITVVANTPAHRQLAGLAAVFTHAVKPCATLYASDARFDPRATPICTPDADPACAAQLRPSEADA